MDRRQGSWSGSEAEFLALGRKQCSCLRVWGSVLGSGSEGGFSLRKYIIAAGKLSQIIMSTVLERR